MDDMRRRAHAVGFWSVGAPLRAGIVLRGVWDCVGGKEPVAGLKTAFSWIGVHCARLDEGPTEEKS